MNQRDDKEQENKGHAETKKYKQKQKTRTKEGIPRSKEEGKRNDMKVV